jgi:hypothetical protein
MFATLLYRKSIVVRHDNPHHMRLIVYPTIRPVAELMGILLCSLAFSHSLPFFKQNIAVYNRLAHFGNT